MAGPESASKQRGSRGRLWVQFHDGTELGPVFGPFQRIETDQFAVEALTADGMETVALRVAGDGDELESAVWALEDDLEHPRERWPDFSVASAKPVKAQCPRCVERASCRWNPSSEIRNGSAYRDLSTWAALYGLTLYPDGRVGSEILGPLEARRARPEVQREIECIGPLQSIDDAEIVNAVSADRGAVYVTALRLARQEHPALLDAIPDGSRLAVVQVGGLLSPSAAGIVLTKKRRGKIAKPEIAFSNPSPDPVLVVGATGDGNAAAVWEADLIELELLAAVLSRQVSRATYPLFERLVPTYGSQLVEALEAAFDDEPNRKRLRPNDVVDIDDLPSLHASSAALIDEYGPGDLLDRGWSALDGEIATLPESALNQVCDAFEKVNVRWLRSDVRMTAVAAAIGAG